MSNNIPTNNTVPSMVPNDPKVWRPTEAILSSLGTNNYLAYYYYEGLRVYVADTKEIWEWREVAPGEENTGLISSDFTYPSGVVVEDIDYSNRTFNFFKVLQASDISLPTITVYDANNVGGGTEIYKDTTGTGPVTFNFRTLVKEALGIGEELIDSIEVQGDTVVVKGKTIGTTNLDIYVAPDGTLMIDSPVSSTNLSFYVDVNSTADTETGNLASPFKTLNKALVSFIGTGTWYNPQYKGYKITLLSNCTLLETPGADYNGYVNLDINNLNIEGNGFFMSLNANPSPDYYPISTRRMVADMPKTANILDYEIQLNFSNVIIQRIGTNAIFDNLNYSYPTVVPNGAATNQQNKVSLEFYNVIMTNDTNYLTLNPSDWQTVPNPADSGNDLLFYGLPVYVSNTASIGVPMGKSEGLNWDTNTGLRMENDCQMRNSNGTHLYFKDTRFQSYSIPNVSFGRNNHRRMYDTLVEGFYSPKTGLYCIELDNCIYARFTGATLLETIPYLVSTEVSPRNIQVGGSETLCKAINNSFLILDEECNTGEMFENMFKFDGTSKISLNSFNDNYSHSEDIHGVFQVIAPLPTSSKEISITDSSLNGVVVDDTGVDKSYISKVNGYRNTINNAPHSTYPSYADDAAAKAAGLIRGNVYFNTIIGGLKVVI